MLPGVRTDALKIWGRTESHIIGRQGGEILELRRSVSLREGNIVSIPAVRVGPLTFDDSETLMHSTEVHTLAIGFSGLVEIIKASILIVVIVRVHCQRLGATRQPGEPPG